jgi:hypothetical protein
MPDGKEDSMSHADEGTLHAYLDGELPSVERGALDSHLAQCAACRARLADERALLERASALLGSTRPTERPVPPFDQVQRAPRRPWYMRRLAWAASLVVAVGFGYLLAGTVGRPQPVAFEQRTAAAPAAASARAVDALGDRAAPIQEKTTRPARPPAQSRPAPLPPAVDVASGAAAVDSPRVARDSGFARGLALQQRGVLRAAPAPDSARGDSVRGYEAPTVSDAARARAEAGRRRPAAGATPDANRLEGVRNLVATTWPVISRGAAASLLGERPVGVPGLATRGIRRSPGADSTVVVEQALDSSTVIQIFQRSAAALERRDSAGAGFAGRDRERADRILARYVGRLRVEIQGPVSTDSLNRLLEQLEPLP